MGNSKHGAIHTGGFTKDKKEIDKFFKKILKNKDEPKNFYKNSKHRRTRV